jgi:hypothetical protein
MIFVQNHGLRKKGANLARCGREKARNQHVGIDHHPNHPASGIAERFLPRRYVAISVSMSPRVRTSSPRSLAPDQAFCSQSGGGAVRMKSRTLMIATAGSPQRSTMKRSLFLLPELGAGDVCVDAPIRAKY